MFQLWSKHANFSRGRYTDQAAGVPGASPIEVRGPGTWTASYNPLWALRMRVNQGGWDRSKVNPDPKYNGGVFWANASLGRGGVIGCDFGPIGCGGGASVFKLVDHYPLIDNCTCTCDGKHDCTCDGKHAHRAFSVTLQ